MSARATHEAAEAQLARLVENLCALAPHVSPEAFERARARLASFAIRPTDLRLMTAAALRTLAETLPPPPPADLCDLDGNCLLSVARFARAACSPRPSRDERLGALGVLSRTCRSVQRLRLERR